MLRDQPLTGAGPGNFRQVYLQYKADESSEEIRDPHNFVLDAWSSSGLIGLAGLLLIISCTGWRLIKRPLQPDLQEMRGDLRNLATPRVQKLRVAVGGLLSGFLVHTVWTWFNGSDEWTSEPIRLLLLGGLSLLILRGQPSFRPVDSATGLAAASAMMVNLLAAGGFEMPAVMMTLLLCLAAGIRCDGRQSYVRGKKRSFLCTVACLAACTLIIRCGLLPVTASKNHIEIGNSLLANPLFPARALDQFQQARQADPESVTPRQQIAEVLSYRLAEAVSLRAAETSVKAGPSIENTDNRKLADEVLDACENLISADRRNSFSYRLRAEVRRNVDLLHKADLLQNLAIQDLQMAISLYPSSVDAWYCLAWQLDAAGAEHVVAAKVAAERVLELENVNRAWGHADRFLTEEQLLKTNRIARR